MNSRQKTVLFYVSLTSISLGNLVLIYTLFSHFVMGQHQEHMQWLLGGFVTEMVGCFVFGWHYLLKPAVVEKPMASNDSSASTLQIINSGPQGLAKDNVQTHEDLSDPWMPVVVEGRGLLENARKEDLSEKDRIKFAKQAIERFSEIPKNSKSYINGVHNTGTAYRELGKFSKAFENYDKARKFLLDSNSFFSEEETTNWLSAIKMMEGVVFEHQHLYPEAKERFLGAWGMKRNYFMPLLNLFELSYRSHNLTEAELLKDFMTTYKEYSEVAEMVEVKLDFLRDYYAKKAA